MGRPTASASATPCVIHFLTLKRDAIETLVRLEASATAAPWTGQNLEDSFATSADCHIIECRGDNIGYCVVQRVLDEAELLNIVIFKQYQSQGYGREAINKLKQDLAQLGIKTLFLEVRASNITARALYVKSGFNVINTRRNYYRVTDQENEDALVMRCLL